ncbi:hypothetical protein TNCT_430751 [Trichonephila clavata]|uniref:Uncharacterized protein n=1 Tax=Trichonephila clavata TaxID=2740835 RepID=A0A8X6LC05_TRICU|nr:hypothetical protein TNCT_430751 [Trichonephila clavata]
MIREASTWQQVGEEDYSHSADTSIQGTTAYSNRHREAACEGAMVQLKATEIQRQNVIAYGTRRYEEEDSSYSIKS